MRKDNEVQQMIKKISYLDLIVGLALGIIVYFIKSNYVSVCLLGFFIAIISFQINSFTVQYAFHKNRDNSNFLMILSYFFRMLLVSIIGIILFINNELNLIAYVVGYTAHFLPLIIYALLQRVSNGRSE